MVQQVCAVFQLTELNQASVTQVVTCLAPPMPNTDSASEHLEIVSIMRESSNTGALYLCSGVLEK